MPAESVRTCRKCGETKPLEQFPAFKRGERTYRHHICAECKKAMARAKYHADPEYWRERAKQEYWKDPETARAKAAAIRERDRELILVRRRASFAGPEGERQREQARRWKRDNPEAMREINRRRQALKRSVTVEYVDPLVLLERADGVCGICDEDLDPMSFTIDHIVPLIQGGEHSYANTQPAHASCNYSKGGRSRR